MTDKHKTTAVQVSIRVPSFLGSQSRFSQFRQCHFEAVLAYAGQGQCRGSRICFLLVYDLL